MLFQVKTLTGKRFELNTIDFMTIYDIKEYIQQNEGMETSQIRLIFSGRMMNDTDLIQNIITVPNSTINMVLSLRGG
jgi:hypothetical protein